MTDEEDLAEIMDEVLEGLSQEGGEKRERCSEETLESIILDFVKKFEVALSIGYVDFLKKTNGAVFEDVVFCYVWDKQSKNEKLNQLSLSDELVSVNEHYRKIKLSPKYAVLGFDEQKLYVYHAIENFYAALNIKEYDILKRFETFEELFQEAIENPLS